MMVVFFFLWFYLVCSYYVAPERTSKPKHGGVGLLGVICSYKNSTRIYTLFVSTPQIARIGGMVIDVKSTPHLQLHLVRK